MELPALANLRIILAHWAGTHPEIRRMVLFGSLARGDHQADSDVDLVADFAPGGIPSGMAGFAYLDDLEAELAARLNHKVHLVESGAIESARRHGSGSLSKAVERDGMVIYEPEPEAV